MGFTHHVEEYVEAVRLSGVSRDDEDDGDGVDCARLGHDPRFPREAKRLARVTNRALAGPEAIGDEHYYIEMSTMSDMRMGLTMSENTNECKGH
jgi:hypothetical protein